MSVDYDHTRLNSLVQRFLAAKVLEDQRTEGYACAGDILLYCGKREIIIPSRLPVLWINHRVADVIRNGSAGFDLEEVEGYGPGINFRWCFIEKDLLQDSGPAPGRPDAIVDGPGGGIVRPARDQL